MSDDRDQASAPDPWGPLLEAGLSALPCPPLPTELSVRVGKLAHAHLAPPPQQPAPELRFRLREALVPALLMSAAIVRAADTMHVAQQVFGEAEAADEPQDGGEDAG
jgi:hypothetical protein